MKRILIIAYSAFLILLTLNFFYYRSLYRKQMSYLVELLDRQVEIVGLSVDNANNGFLSDLNQVIFSEDFSRFFDDAESQFSAKERMKLFFSKYQDLVTGIKLNDNKKNEFTLKKDETSNNWLEQTFILHVQGEIFRMEKLAHENMRFEYYLPVIKDNITIGNIAVTVDYKKYFSEIFSAFNLKDYQWEWVLSETGEIIYTNSEEEVEYSQIEKIIDRLDQGSKENIYHNATINGKTETIISSYYSTNLLQRDIGLVFSAPADVFQKSIIKNSILIALATLLIVQTIIFIFWRYIRSQKSEIEQLNAAEKTLFQMIEEMPVGVIIYNKAGEIIKANKVAAIQYSYDNAEEIKGSIFQEKTLSDDNDYFSKHLGGTFTPDRFIILKKDNEEIILFRNSIPFKFKGEDANMEILIDVTMLERARNQEAKANLAKSEYLARMSYEIRTPLNGIIGITDVLNEHRLPEETREIVKLLQRSTEVLLNVVNDILDFSKIEMGGMKLDEIPFDLREEINYCADLARTKIDSKTVKLTYTVENNVPEKIIGDPFRIRQILTNLINHSINNTKKGEIRLKCMLKNNQNRILTLGFELLDSGDPFDNASLKKIFGDYMNGESKVLWDQDESGFGTILSRQLIEHMGGELNAESPSGIAGDQGTRITFTITTYSGDRPVKNIITDKINSPDKIKTLIITGDKVRDEEILGILHKLRLSLNVTTFHKSTVNQIKTNLDFPDERYHLVVIFDDSDFDGFDAARIINENGLSDSFIMILISSNDKKSNYHKCFTLGIDHYIIKPVEINKLAEIIRSSFPGINNMTFLQEKDNTRNDIKILVIEDNKMSQKVLGALLKTLGYTFDVADDGYSGYLKAKDRKYDVIFMDLIMPEMDGYESARKILDYDRSVLIAAFTADNLPETKRKAELSGIKEFISKPVRINDLKILFAKYFNEN